MASDSCCACVVLAAAVVLQQLRLHDAWLWMSGCDVVGGGCVLHLM